MQPLLESALAGARWQVPALTRLPTDWTGSSWVAECFVSDVLWRSAKIVLLLSCVEDDLHHRRPLFQAAE
jgi:hypothetical protein